MKLHRTFRHITSVLALGWATLAAARTGPAPAEAEAMARQAAALVRADGAGAACRAFSNSPAFNSAPGYAAVFDLQGRLLAHSRDASQVGRNLLQAQDANGVEVIKMFTAIATQLFQGWSEGYVDIDPVTGHWLDEAAYVERVGDAYVAVAIAVDAGDISEGW